MICAFSRRAVAASSGATRGAPTAAREMFSAFEAYGDGGVS